MTSGENYRCAREATRNFARKGIGRKEKQRILILTEGQKTEILYLQKLCKRFGIFEAQVAISDIFEEGDSVDLKHVGSAPKTIVKEARKELKKREKGSRKFFWKKIFCVFDRDQHSTFSNAIQQIKDLNASRKEQEIKAFISDICFELWFFIHFKYSTVYDVKCGDLIKKLREINVGDRCPFRDYDKGRAEYFNETFKYILTAKKNAIKLRNEHKMAQFGPYTEIDLLIDSLLSSIPLAFFAISPYGPMINEYKKLRI